MLKKLLLWMLLATPAFGQFTVGSRSFFTPVAPPSGQLWDGILNAGIAINWTNVGVPGGIPSPGWTQSGSTIAAVAGDMTGTIQTALNACGTNHFVLLGTGTFRVNSSLSIPSNCALRGMGANLTILDVHGTSGAPIMLGGGGVTFSPTSITAGATAGSTGLTLTSSAGVILNQFLVVTDNNDNVIVDIRGGEGNCNWCDGGWTANAHLAAGQIIQVTNISGVNVTINPALYRAYPNSPVAVPFSATTQFAGVEALQIFDNNTGYTQDIQLAKCEFCWVKGVEVNYTASDFVDVYWGYHDEIRDSYFSNNYTHTSGSADGDISFLYKTSESLIENNIIERSHVCTILSWGAAGNVVAYNYCEGGLDQFAPNFVIGGMGAHGAHPQYNLWEGNVLPALNPDEIWGTNAFNTMYRNWAQGTTKACNPVSGRGSVVCTPVGQNGAAGVNGWFPFQGSRAFELNHLSTHDAIVGGVAGSLNQASLHPYGGGLATNVPSLQWSTTPPNPTRSYDSSNYNIDFGYGEASDDGTGTGCSGSTNPPCHSTTAFSTALLQCNYTYADDAISSCPTPLPPSFYRAVKPSFFGSGPFPAIGPDVTSGGPEARTHADLIPAEACFFNVMGGTEGGAGGPYSFNADLCYP